MLGLLNRMQGGAIPSRSFLPPPGQPGLSPPPPVQYPSTDYPSFPAGPAGVGGRPAPQSYFPGGVPNFWSNDGRTLNIPGMAMLMQQRAQNPPPAPLPSPGSGGGISAQPPVMNGAGVLPGMDWSRFQGNPQLPNPSYVPPARMPPVQSVMSLDSGLGMMTGRM